ncbi:hypothetical protein niasHT_002996 [Heterodera trifolii]|uniref:Uncharacterized protein n=1 Tax=Heterodera trifolii TaxID=157864 RepID=A0ABD2LU67_9BILA
MTTTTLKVIFPWRRFASVSPAAPALAAVLGAAFRRAFSSTTIACCCCIHSPQHYYSFRFCRLRRAKNESRHQLNALQSNAQTLALARTQQETRPEWRMEETREFMGILGISLGRPLTVSGFLNVVANDYRHKRKRFNRRFSVRPFLRSLGYKTGFLQVWAGSPHLVHVRERNSPSHGRPISKARFSPRPILSTFYNTLFRATKKERSELTPSLFQIFDTARLRIFATRRVVGRCNCGRWELAAYDPP